jgi:hypothetical protein
MGGLPLFFKPKHNSFIRPTDKISIVTKLATVKKFDRLTTWGDVWSGIYQMPYWTYRYVISAAKYRNKSLH